MKLLSTTAGILAIGALGIHHAQAESKPWSLSATLRGFYDDNYATTPSGTVPGAQSSYGFEFSPSAGYSFAREQSSVALKYTYGLRYYENRDNSADHSHQLDALLKHAFTPRARITVDESFVIAQEAALLDRGVVITPLRSNGNNIRNTASVTLENEWTRLLGTELAYSNTFYDYEQTGPASRSALLDRTEHLIRADLRWAALQTTTVIFGYQFGIVDQTSKDFLDLAGTLLPNMRDNRSHYAYVGADHFMTEQLSFHPRVGVQYTEYPNAPAGTSGDHVSPYADFSAVYRYSEESNLQIGVKHNLTQTDVAAGTLDAETTTIYGSLKHQFTAKISGSLIGQYQMSEFNGGGNDGKSDKLGIVGVNVAYAINEFLTAETGYNYDRLLSELGGRSFTRNRVYIGIRATY